MGRSNELDGLTTLPELLVHSIERHKEKEALRQFNRTAGRWESLSYKDLGARVELWRRAYAAAGLQRGERVAILLPNGVDAVCADEGALANGLIPVPLHAIDTPGASAFIAMDSQASMLVTNKLERWNKMKSSGVQMPNLRLVLALEETAASINSESNSMPRICCRQKWLEAADAYVGDLPTGPLEDDLAGIIYTSGTTGRPKGVMLTHRNVVSNIKDTLECVSPQTDDVFLSFLPLSHTFERTAGYYLALACGCTIVYNRSILLLAEDLKTVRPTVIISVPRVYERIYARVQDRLRKSSGIARAIFERAVQIGWRDFCRRNRMPIEDSRGAWLDPLLRPLILEKVSTLLQSQFGGRLRIAISGGASLNAKVARTFCGLGLPIIQGYGLTEASPIIAGNCVEFNQPDTVGRPFQHVEVRLGENGEIQIRGPSIMKGYWNRPEDSQAAFTKDCWLRTGDVGEFTSQGLLKIKGRIKEIIVTSTGEKVPPADLEAAIETDPLFAQAYVVGENKPFLGLLAVVSPEHWKALAESLGLDPEAEASLEAPAAKTSALKRAKAAAANFPNYALPRAVVLTKTAWTIDNGLLTPTLKLKREPLSRFLRTRIDSMYASHG